MNIIIKFLIYYFYLTLYRFMINFTITFLQINSESLIKISSKSGKFYGQIFPLNSLMFGGPRGKFYGQILNSLMFGGPRGKLYGQIFPSNSLMFGGPLILYFFLIDCFFSKKVSPLIPIHLLYYFFIIVFFLLIYFPFFLILEPIIIDIYKEIIKFLPNLKEY